MKKILYILAFLSLGFVFTSCEDDPPIAPEPPSEMGCSVSGDMIVEYESGKGFISFLTGDRFQFYFSSYKTIESIEYGLLVSLFPENPSDTSGVFQIVHPSTNPKPDGNYAYAAFFKHNEKPNEEQYWAIEGEVLMTLITIGKDYHRLKGSFYFEANDKKTSEKHIGVTNGWVDMFEEL